VGESRSLFTFAARPAPCRLPRSGAGLVKGRAGRFRLSPRCHARVDAPCVNGERCLSPTSATDLRPRAPSTDHPIPARAASRKGPSRGDLSVRGTDLPSVVGPPADPRVERRLTATLQLQPSPTTPSRRASGA